jgi:hypothetical protein
MHVLHRRIRTGRFSRRRRAPTGVGYCGIEVRDIAQSSAGTDPLGIELWLVGPTLALLCAHPETRAGRHLKLNVP